MAMEFEGYFSDNEKSSTNSDHEEESQQLLSNNLIKALMENDVNQLRSLHEAGESFSCCDKNGNTLLHLAIMGQAERSAYTVMQMQQLRKFKTSHTFRKDAFDYLVTLDEIPKDAKNSRGASVLMEAFSYLQDDPECTVKLIDAGCEIHEPFADGSTCLHWAIENEWIEVAELLIERGFDVNVRNTMDETSLYLACRYGLVDEIWMLLFYGADPNMLCPIERILLHTSSEVCMSATCFDVAVGQFVKPEVQEIMFDQLPGYSKHFNLLTIIETMKNNVEIFHKLMQVASKINYCDKELQQLRREFSSFKPELLRIFVEKFDYVILDMFKNCSLEILFFKIREKQKAHIFAENMFTIFGSNLVNDVVRILNSYSGFNSVPLNNLINNFRNHKDDDDVDILTQLICCMLSYGVEVTAEAVDAIYFHFGYCDLFKIMLHMDIRDMSDWTDDLVPRIIYDVRLTVKSLITNWGQGYVDNRRKMHLVFDHFALPTLVERCIEQRKRLRYWMGEQEEGDDDDDDDDDSDFLLQKIRKLPLVPSLVELARNCAREYIVYKYKTKTSSQFYTILNRLPIAKILKEIISYERKLYP